MLTLFPPRLPVSTFGQSNKSFQNLLSTNGVQRSSKIQLFNHDLSGSILWSASIDRDTWEHIDRPCHIDELSYAHCSKHLYF